MKSAPSRRSPWRHRGLIGVALANLLTGCVAFGSRDKIPTRTYRLDYDPPAVAGDSLPVVLHVAPFRMAAAYDREAIIYRDSRYATNTYFYHRWVASPAKMLADLITRDLAHSQRYQAAQQGPSLLSGDYLLQADVEQIEEAPAGEACAAHLRMQVLASRLRTLGPPVVFQTAYDATEACPCNAPNQLAEAMSRALASISQQLQADLASAIANDLAAKRR